VTRYLLDTNIISNATKPSPSQSLSLWMSAQADENLFIASMVIAEIWRGILETPTGKKRTQLERWFNATEGPRALFAGRVLPFDEKAGIIWGRLMAESAKAGRPRSSVDMILAAVAEANNCTVVTDNEKDFYGLKFINPMRSRDH
jgi:predicted nucleic acid-binding protein